MTKKQAFSLWCCIFLALTSAWAREFQYQSIELGQARTQRPLHFYTELPQNHRDLENFPRHVLSCGAPVTPITFQILKDGENSLAFVTFTAPQANGHILMDPGHRQKTNLLDYFLFEPGGTPFCEAKIEQTLSQCGTAAITLSHNKESMLKVEIKNLSTNQVFYINWNEAKLISEGKSYPILPTDIYLYALEDQLQGRAMSVFSQERPLDALTLLGLGTRMRLAGLSMDYLQEDLATLSELSRKIDVSTSNLFFEPLNPAQNRTAFLAVQHNQNWKISNLFLPSTRDNRFTLSVPIARVQQTIASSPTPTGKSTQSLSFPQGKLSDGMIQITQPKALPTELCNINFLIH